MTQRLPAIDPATATSEVRLALHDAEERFGTLPPVMPIMANSPAALIGYLALDTALSEGTLDIRVRHQVALAVAEANDCESCATAHTVAGMALGLDEATIEAARLASSPDLKVQAALQFARTVAEYRGDITDDEYDRLRRAGYTTEEIAEIIANVVLSVYTSYFMSVARAETHTQAGRPEREG